MSNVSEISTNRREAILSGASEERLVGGNLTNLEICTQRPIQMKG